MSDSDSLLERLSLLGLRAEQDQESRALSLLRVILRTIKEPSNPLTFAEIYKTFLEEEPGREFTKAWVHRVLKSLIDSGFVRVESPTAHRKRYTSDISSVMDALERLRQEKMQELEEKRKHLEKEHKSIIRIDAGGMAQELIELLCGKKQVLESRSIRGLDEWHRVTGSSIFEKAKPGDIIRTSVVVLGPYLTDVENRMGRIFKAAARGVEIRYFIPVETFLMDGEIQEKIPREWMQKAMELVVRYSKDELVKFDIRVNTNPKRMFAFVSLNRECIAFMVSEQPIMGAWMTREFNPHLIDRAIDTFEEVWERSKSITDFSPEDTAMFGASGESIVHSLLKRGEKAVELDDSSDRGEPDI